MSQPSYGPLFEALAHYERARVLQARGEGQHEQERDNEVSAHR